MWLLRDVQKTRSLMEWSLRVRRQDGEDPERAATAKPTSPRGADRSSARAALPRASTQRSTAIVTKPERLAPMGIVRRSGRKLFVSRRSGTKP